MREADRIVVMAGGVIRETGTHDALCARGSYYASMVERQRLGFLSEPDGAAPVAFERQRPATPHPTNERGTLAAGSLTVFRPIPASADAGLLSPTLPLPVAST